MRALMLHMLARVNHLTVEGNFMPDQALIGKVRRGHNHRKSKGRYDCRQYL